MKKRGQGKLNHIDGPLSALARFKAPYLAVEIREEGRWFHGRVVAVCAGEVIASFGTRLRATRREIQEAIGEYLTLKFEMSMAKRRWIEGEIARLKAKTPRPRGPDSEQVRVA